MKSLVIFLTSTLSLLCVSFNPIGKPPKEVALQFYNWYLKNIYSSPSDKLSNPDIKLINSTYQIISEAQFERLRKTNFFSNEYYKNQTVIYNACNVQLSKVGIKQVEKCGCSPTTFVESNECDFIGYYTWIGGQGETINTAKVIKVETIGNLSKVTIRLSYYQTAYSLSEVTLLKEDGNWKISRIKVHF